MSERRAAIVTGAGSGIGRAICAELADQGFGLVLVGRRRSVLEETAEMVGRSGPAESLVVDVDIASDDAADRIVQESVDRWGRVDAVVNNAGAAELCPIGDTGRALLERMYAVNLVGPVLLIAAVWPVFVKQGRGCVVNVSSMATLDPLPGFTAYGASKAALENVTRSMMNEGTEHGIEAYSVAPGAVETPMLRRLVSEEQFPRDLTLEPAHVAEVVGECVSGKRGGGRGDSNSERVKQGKR